MNTRHLPPRSSRRPYLVLQAVLLGWLLSLLAGLPLLRAQDSANDNPTGPSGDYNGEVTTGGSYDPFTHNAKRAITDLVVPGSNGTYPLTFTRTYNSLPPAKHGVDKQIFGDGGNWRHSYMWTISAYYAQPGDQATQGTFYGYDVSYPDGSVITFRPRKDTAPANEIYWRGPTGTQDRLEASSSGNPAGAVLHLSDGGLVTFGGNRHALSIVDPYGATTTLKYMPSNPEYLMDVIEPGGRSLHLEYGTATTTTGGKTQTWVVLKTVTSNGTSTTALGGSVQRVTYNYGFSGDHTHDNGNTVTYDPSRYCVLTDVSYDTEASINGGQVHATYTYAQSNGSFPVVGTAVDPHYAGAMTSICYQYVDPAYGFIANEVNINGTTGVSSLASDYRANTRTETRGDKGPNSTLITRTFRYGESSHAGGSTLAKSSQLTSCTDFEGNTTNLYYYGHDQQNGSGEGNLFLVVDARGNQTTYNHEPITGKVNVLQLPDGRQRKWLYWSKDATNGSGNLQPYYLLQSTDERNKQTNYTRYTNTGLVHLIDYPDGSREEFVYTQFAGYGGTSYYYKLGYHKTKLGAEIYYNYNSNPNNPNNANQQSDLLRSVTRYYDDGTGTNHKVSETTYMDYDALDRLYLTTDPRNVATRTTYNARHQLVQTMHMADSTHVDLSYDDYGNCTYVTDELTHPSATSYDEYRRPTVVVHEVQDGTNDHHVDYFNYDQQDANGNTYAPAASHTRANWSTHQQQSSRYVRHVYSANGWLTDTYAGNQHNHTDYNAVGLAQATSDALGLLASSTYDNCNRPATTTDANGHVSTNAYYGPGEAATGGSGANCAGLLKSTTVPSPDLGAPTVTTTSANYDSMGRLRQSVAPPNYYNVNSITYNSAYDAAGNLTSQDDGIQAAPQHLNGYNYDGLGRKVSITYPDSTTERWTYDAAGNIATYVSRANQTKTYNYDGRNRLSSTSWSNHAGFGTSYEYDAASRVTRIYNDYSDNHFTYDQAGGLLSESAQILSMPVKTTSYVHDIDGRVVSINYPHGDRAGYKYDALGRCTAFYPTGSPNTLYGQYNYDARGQLASRCLPAIGVDTGYTYQNNGRLLYVWDYKGGSDGSHTANKSIRLQYYGYAPDGRISWTYRAAGYDQTGRNSQLDNNQGDAYYYFPDGTLNAAWRNFGTKNNAWPAQMDATKDARVDPANLVSYGGPAPSDARGYAYDRAGNRTSSGNSNYTYSYVPEGENRYQGMGYDANGNTTSPNDGWSYTYNADNQLVAASGPSNQAMYFGYDGLGRLVADNINGVPKVFYYAGSQRIEEWNNSSQANVCQYYFDAPGSDTILLRIDARYGYLWPLYDAQGNTTHLCGNTGQVLEMYLYDAYGTPTVYDPSGNVRAGGTAYDNRYLFKGAAAYQWYAPAGLYYCRARFYQPYHGRWLQPDPIGQAGGLNIYTYCGNDPVNGVDASGLASDNLQDNEHAPGVNSTTLTGSNIPNNMMEANFVSMSFPNGVAGGGNRDLVPDSSGRGVWYLPPGSPPDSSSDPDHIVISAYNPVLIMSTKSVNFGFSSNNQQPSNTGWCGPASLMLAQNQLGIPYFPLWKAMSAWNDSREEQGLRRKNFNKEGDDIANAKGAASKMGMNASYIAKGQIEAAVKAGNVVIVAIPLPGAARDSEGRIPGHGVAAYSFQDANHIGVYNPLVGSDHSSFIRRSDIISENNNIMLSKH